MEFLNKKHGKRYEILLGKLNTYSSDRERSSLFYIISGNNELYKQIDNIYNFKENCIRLRAKRQLSSSGDKLVKLAFQLYNSSSSSLSVMDIFSTLDSNNGKLALLAIKYRFNIS